eukprot:gnl/MRDRNA2_/MRDRNA2_91450_c0_seq1.p1 gnl/MRDRNA2_/MRDRNA2_91450_c0~~gnl/MRDRNA2_/MRDRNA2_91450_c0_seq1.p1  ORF type:complete len:718 (+),score=186.68 gnl/MRDRNA2_/MRDRNA2_91450_c0_seq1:122-2275(+)
MFLKSSNAILCILVILDIVSGEEVCFGSEPSESCRSSGIEEATLAESYLQNFAFHGARKLQVTAEGEQEEAPIQQNVTLLDLADRARLLSQSEARAARYKGHTFYLRRVLSALAVNKTEEEDEDEFEVDEDGKPKKGRKKIKKTAKKKLLKKSQGASVEGKNLEDVVGDFIDSQSESEDACHSQLYEARHQLNQLHDIVIRLAEEVNTTEEAIVVLDKALQEKLKELEELEVWKKKELDICEKKRQEAIEMFRRLSNEMEEMHQIASPDVSMDISGRLVHDSLLQSATNSTGPLREPLLHKFDESPAVKKKMTSHQELDKISTLMSQTEQASLAFQACKAGKSHSSSLLQMQEIVGGPGCKKSSKVKVIVGGKGDAISPYSNMVDKMKETYRCSKVNPGYHGVVWITCSEGKLAADPQRCFKEGGGATETEEEEEEGEEGEEGEDVYSVDYKTREGTKSSKECLEEKENMEKVYIKAYVELSRLKTEYDELANSTACFDAVNSEYKDKKVPLQEAADTLSDKIAALEKKLESLRPQLESATNAEALLRKQVKTLTNECEDLEPTISDLDKVRDAIRALSECPGLTRSKFALPKWIGEWVRIKQTKKGQSDRELDLEMDKACKKAAKGTRAAEIGEIEEATVLGIPRTNTGKVPLLGTCPNCEGDDDDSRASGHLRKCWRADKNLNMKDKSTNCGQGPRIVLCVQDNPDIRVIPGEDL